MDEVRGKTATWRFDTEMVAIQYDTRWRAHAFPKLLGRCELPLAAIAAVEFSAEGKKGWRLRLRLREGADPFAAVGALLPEKGQPFLLTGAADTELVAEYHADQLRLTAEAARLADDQPAADYALGLVPPVPLHIETEEGSARFDGRTLRLEWSDDAGFRKRKQRRVEYALDEILRMDWFPQKAALDDGYLRVVTRDDRSEAGPGDPGKDFACLVTEDSAKQDARTLLMAATVTAHLWAAAPRQAELTSTPDTPDTAADSPNVYDRIRELGRLHREGLLTDDEFTTKKAELLDRL